MRDAAPIGAHQRISDASGSPENASPAHHPASEPAPDAVTLAFRLFARQGVMENAVVTAREEQENAVVTAAPLVCFSCWGGDFWQGSGAVVCRRCHPPAPGAEVLTLTKAGSDASRPVEMNAGSSAPTPDTRTHGVRGGVA